MNQQRFDIREYARTAYGNFQEFLDFDELTAEPLSSQAQQLVFNLYQFETSTMGRLRNLLVTATHKDARVTAFLTTWTFEKFWIAQALQALLPKDFVSTKNKPDRRGPIRRAIRGIMDGSSVVPAHVTVGLINERILAATYEKLRTAAPQLNPMLDRIQTIRARHVEFFEQETRNRLHEDRKALKITLRELKHTAIPFGLDQLSPKDKQAFMKTVHPNQLIIQNLQNILKRA